jgi:hypothetical protein
MPLHLNAFSRAYGPREHACGTWASLPIIPVYRQDAPLLACHVAEWHKSDPGVKNMSQKTVGYCWPTRESRKLSLTYGFFEGTRPWRCLAERLA